MQVVADLARLGTREVTLIGGEAYLRRDWVEIVSAVVAAGMQCTLQSGGFNLNDERIRAAKEAGLSAAGISIDGPRELHDELRGVRGSFDAAVAALHRLREHEIPSSVNTQITPMVVERLDDVLDVVADAGARNWQLQLTVPMGRAGDSPHLILQPSRLLELFPKIVELYQRAERCGVLLQIGNNIGYFGPFEGELRGSGLETIHYDGCLGGQNAMGIEADGKVKGCPSLPTEGYVGGNLRDVDLSAIWFDAPELSFSRQKTSDPWGFCGSCYYARVCRGGCTWMAHSLLGKPGNNPFCHHRVLELERQGLREEIRPVKAGPGTPFDHGIFEIIVQTASGEPSDALALDETARASGVSETRLIVCYGCFRHVFAGTNECPFCGADVAERATRRADVVGEAKRFAAELLAELRAGI